MNEKVELNQFLSARAIRSLPGTWLIESEDYIIYISSMQISALIPKKAPFLCGGYWDDIAFAGALVEKNKKFLVLGAGIGSFLPLLESLNPDIFIPLIHELLNAYVY